MSLAEIIEAVSKLTPVEKARVAEELRRKTEPSESDDQVRRQEELNRTLLAEGLINRLPDRTVPPRRSAPIKIDGKPLSETIIEARR